MNIDLRPFADGDLPRFAQWLHRPHVAPWYTPVGDWLYEVENRGGEYAFICHFIIQAGGEPVGFCQYYPYWMGGEDWHGNLPLGGTYSIDYLIGEPEALRRGYGVQAIRLLTRAVFALPDAVRVIVQPEAENAASRAALTAAGYRFDAENGVFILQRADLDA